ncbi:MAG: hypothetical protein WCD63_01765 [Terrimicrobiaceae bacterium]
MSPHSFGVLYEIDRNIFAMKHSGLRVSEPQLIPEVGDSTDSLQSENTLISMIIDDHDRQRERFGYRGNYF